MYVLTYMNKRFISNLKILDYGLGLFLKWKNYQSVGKTYTPKIPPLMGIYERQPPKSWTFSIVFYKCECSPHR